MDVYAAVVHSFERPPRYEPFQLAGPVDDEHELVEVLAVGLHPRVRSGAAGSHYTSNGILPMVPGVDGFGRRRDGRLVYFVADDDLVGPMATHAVVDRRRSIELPADVDVERIAAGMNPAMSAWVALRRRVPFQAGQTVLVLGATGSAGQMAVQIARRFGAGRVVAAGRDPQRLAALASGGADTAVSLAGEPGDVAAALADAAADVDVVLDYLWGAPTSEAIMAILRARGDRSRALSWVQIGSMAGPTIELPSIALRSANLHLLGNGQGAVSTSTYLEELPALAAAIDRHDIDVTAHPTRLADIETTWTAAEPPGTRTVIVM